MKMSCQVSWRNCRLRNTSPYLKNRRWTWRHSSLWQMETWRSWALKQTDPDNRSWLPYQSSMLGRAEKGRSFKRPSITSSLPSVAVLVTQDNQDNHALQLVGWDTRFVPPTRGNPTALMSTTFPGSTPKVLKIRVKCQWPVAKAQIKCLLDTSVPDH